MQARSAPEILVEVPAAPCNDVTITGPDTATAGKAVEFTAMVSPPDAEKPITYTWEAEGLPTVVARLPRRVATGWRLPGRPAAAKTVRVTAANRWGSASAETSVSVQALTIAGPRLALLGQPVSFTAVVSPTDGSKPITYTWYADDLPVTVHVGDGSEDQVTLTWTVAGRKTVVAKAVNQLWTVSAAHTVDRGSRGCRHNGGAIQRHSNSA